MAQKEMITNDKIGSATVVQHEDAVLKTAAQFFAKELLPYLGIDGKVISSAPTESIVLNLKKFYEDINLIMEDGTWKHFEFQSKNEGIPSLKRFRSYEAVTTYVLYSGNIQNPVTSFTEGINTYHVIPIIMKDHSADDLIKTLKEKASSGDILTKADLVPLTLIPLMDGQLSQKERFLQAFSLTENTKDISSEDLQKIEAMIYTMADKFLENDDFEHVKEGIRMTRLGQMLFNDGFNDGFNNGSQEKQLEIARNLIGKLSDASIAETTGLPLDVILKLKKTNYESIKFLTFFTKKATAISRVYKLAAKYSCFYYMLIYYTQSDR